LLQHVASFLSARELTQFVNENYFWLTVVDIKVDGSSGHFILIYTGEYMRAYKAADLNRASNAVLALDPNLVFSLTPGTYRVRAAIFMNEILSGLRVALGGTLVAAALKAQILVNDLDSGTFPDGSVVPVTYPNPQLKKEFRQTALGTGMVYPHAFAGSHYIAIDGTIEVTTQGTLGISWAQETSLVGNLTLQRGSYLEAFKIG
jgi:hypothetical protein